ncbi:MAG TPA: ATP-binding protein [Gammaproteobacteria bacterium]|nr:ATP-binding protein [Gammaproteobacteria bacterium]
MLYKITIENFFSVADCQELVFEVPANAPDLACFRAPRSDDGIRLPVVVGFFGPNASGKSTILRAVVSAAVFASHSFSWADEVNLFFQPYRREDWWGKPTKVTIEFDCQLSDNDSSAIFRYELHIAHKAANFSDKVVAYEALSYAPQGRFRTLFKRKNQEIHFGHEFGISNTNDPRKESIRPNASVISTLAKLNHPLSIYLSGIIGTLQTNIVGVTKVQQNATQWLSIYAQNKDCLARLNKELRRLDIGLESMVVEQSDQGLFAKLYHVGLDDFIFLAEESSGTQRFIEIFPRLHYVLETGSIAIIDEIDTDLHPLLLPELFRWFGDPERNPRGAQLFFTAHNPGLLEDLEKEQVFLTEKPSGQATRVYGARDIQGLRREPNLMRKYLAGELGAVPRIG